MSFLSSFDISGYGLSSQRVRLNMISSNIANANTTRTDEGGPYRRKDVIFRAFDFNEVLNKKLGEDNNLLRYEDPLDEDEWGRKPQPPIMSVYIDKIVRDDTEPRMKYEPQHPDANSEGYVAYPNVNPVVEMSNLIETTRAYQANVAAFQSAKNMTSTALTMFQNA